MADSIALGPVSHLSLPGIEFSDISTLGIAVRFSPPSAMVENIYINWLPRDDKPDKFRNYTLRSWSVDKKITWFPCFVL